MIELSRISERSPEKTRQADSLPLILLCTNIKLTCPTHTYHKRISDSLMKNLSYLSKHLMKKTNWQFCLKFHWNICTMLLMSKFLDKNCVEVQIFEGKLHFNAAGADNSFQFWPCNFYLFISLYLSLYDFSICVVG